MNLALRRRSASEDPPTPARAPGASSSSRPKSRPLAAVAVPVSSFCLLRPDPQKASGSCAILRNFVTPFTEGLASNLVQKSQRGLRGSQRARQPKSHAYLLHCHSRPVALDGRNRRRSPVRITAATHIRGRALFLALPARCHRRDDGEPQIHVQRARKQRRRT